MSRRITERDLAHDADPVRFGDAMVKCEGFSPECSASARCHMEGRCFASSPELVAARMIEGHLLPTDGRAGQHFAYLRRVAEMLRAGKVHL